MARNLIHGGGGDCSPSGQQTITVPPGRGEEEEGRGCTPLGESIWEREAGRCCLLIGLCSSAGGLYHLYNLIATLAYGRGRRWATSLYHITIAYGGEHGKEEARLTSWEGGHMYKLTNIVQEAL